MPTTKRKKKVDSIPARWKLHKKLWDLRSELIRRKEKGICFTCDTRYWNEELGENDWKRMQAGHFRHNVLDFDPENIHCQCPRCNHYLSGNGTEYARRLTKLYGLERVEALNLRADQAQKGELHTYEWYLEEIEKTKQELKTLTQ